MFALTDLRLHLDTNQFVIFPRIMTTLVSLLKFHAYTPTVELWFKDQTSLVILKTIAATGRSCAPIVENASWSLI